MSQDNQITPEQHRGQIAAFTLQDSPYATYAAVLKRVLEHGCAVAFPEALVQSRAKSVSSFAEKCARKFEKYPDAVNQMTDLCGARVIVQTLEQVRAVRQFVEANFEILERDDKGLSLSEDKFGYRDMHYVIRLRADRCQALGITSDEQQQIAERRAELQVRTWLQHAWADTLHDRMYKTPLQLPSDVRRSGALLAAIMEEGDRLFNQMADDLDGMIANYTAFATRDKVHNEITIQNLILENERNAAKKPGLALKLARLLAACGEYDRVVQTLDDHREVRDANRCELLQDLGYALCKRHRAMPQSAEYQRGVQLLEESLTLCRQPDGAAVVHLRRQESLHARALWRLGWALEPRRGQVHRARECLREAHEHEPGNPYYLADMLGLEIRFSPQADVSASMRTLIREGCKTCLAHAAAGIELPGALFTAGRLSLLLEKPLEAVGYYARGIRHVLDGLHCVAPDALDAEVNWLFSLDSGKKTEASHQWVHDLLALADRLTQKPASEPHAATELPRRALIVAGGAAGIDAQTLTGVRPLLEAALEAFSGRVISGGTAIGIPGCVAELAASLAARGGKRFELIGYIPERLPHDAPKDARYDQLVICGQERFSPEQLLRNWTDLFELGIRPEQVIVVGFGGGPVSSVEYRLALAVGATVAVVIGTGGAADTLLADPLWSRLPNLLPVPWDAASVRGVVTPAERPFPDSVLDQMATAFHENYVANSTGRLPDSMKPWSKLRDTYRQANRDQARYAVQILEACGFGVREAESPVLFTDFANDEIERMAELEHGRWNIDRLRGGWRFGPRDDQRQFHNCLVPWAELPENIKEYDRKAVRKFPEILAKAGLEVYRK